MQAERARALISLKRMEGEKFASKHSPGQTWRKKRACPNHDLFAARDGNEEVEVEAKERE